MFFVNDEVVFVKGSVKKGELFVDVGDNIFVVEWIVKYWLIGELFFSDKFDV